MQSLDPGARFFIYGVIGWAAEVVWTAAYELIGGTRKHPTDPRVRVAMTPPERWNLAGLGVAG